jgi:ASC-1-like (ASCH) protein
MNHIILKKDRYNKVKSGEMTCWLTLNDDFAKSLNIGEIVCIVNDNSPNNAKEYCYARLNGYYVYGSFDELYKKVNKNELGYGDDDKKNIELIKSQMYLQCTPESEKQYGVRGIKFEYLPEYKEPKDMTESEAKAYLQNMVKSVKRTRQNLSRDIEKVDGATTALTKLIEINPDLYFAIMDGEIENDMLKYLLSESIKNTQALLEKIQEYEDKTGFLVIRKY